MAQVLADAMSRLDLEQTEAVTLFLDGHAIAGIANRMHRSEESTREVLGEAFFWMSREVRGRHRSMGNR